MLTEQELQKQILRELYVDYRHLTMIDPHKKLQLRDTSFSSVSKQKSISRLVMHCTDAPSWSPEKLSSFFVTERRFAICSYHYYVMADRIYHMVGENVVTPHAAPYNSNSVSFSVDFFASHYENINVKIDASVYENALKTATYLCLKFQVPPAKLFGHRELLGTGFVWSDAHDKKLLRKTCPGLTIDLDIFRFEVSKRIQEVLGVVVDGIFGAKSQKEFSNFFIS